MIAKNEKVYQKHYFAIIIIIVAMVRAIKCWKNYSLLQVEDLGQITTLFCYSQSSQLQM